VLWQLPLLHWVSGIISGLAWTIEQLASTDSLNEMKKALCDQMRVKRHAARNFGLDATCLGRACVGIIGAGDGGSRQGEDQLGLV